MKRIPTYLITGFLGCGKTTFIQSLLKDVFLDKVIALIENEIGEVSIDSKTISTKHVKITEVTAGCFCCELSSGFTDAIGDILKEISPHCILIETTGVANPMNLVLAASNDSRLRLEGIITIVDVENIEWQVKESLSATLQIACADVILLNKTDLVEKQHTQRVKKFLEKKTRRAWMVEKKKGVVNILFDHRWSHDSHRISNLKKDASLDVNHLIKDEIETFSLPLPTSVSFVRLENFLNGLSKEVYRLKGFLRIEDKKVLLNYVTGRYVFDYDAGKENNNQKEVLVFIGKKILEQKPTITQQLSYAYENHDNLI